MSDSKKPAAPKMNIRPIGQVPLPKSPQIHISGNIVGAIPTKRPISLTSAPPSLITLRSLPPAIRPAALPAPLRPAFAINSQPSVKPDSSTPGLAPTVATTKHPEKSQTKTKIPPPAPHTVRSAAGEVWQDPTLADWDPNDFRIFVGDLGPDVTDAMLNQAFVPFGSLTKARIIRDKKTHKSRGYGFVAFREPQDFLRALKEMDGKYIGTRPVKLKKSTWTDRCVDSDSVKKARYKRKAEMPPKRRPNLALEIGILEAQKGLEPAIGKCKYIAYKRMRRNQLDVDNVDGTLSHLRQQRLERKMFTVKRLIQRAAKKARTFAVQRCIKKIKLAEKEEKKKSLEEQMCAIKALDLAMVARLLFAEKVVKSSEYLAQRLTPLVEESNIATEKARLVEGNGLSRALAEIASSTEEFIRSLYREQVETPQVPQETVAFVMSLNQPEERQGNMSERPRRPSKPEKPQKLGAPQKPSKPAKRKVEEDWEEEEGKKERGKNRKGQRARRAEWERMYGEQARHLRESAVKPTRNSFDRKEGPPAEEANLPRNRPVRPTRQDKAVLAEKLHPSWEAQRRQRELLKAAASHKPINNKIKFADDDE